MSTDSDAAGAAPWVMELGSRDVILSEAKDLSVDEEPHTV
jgi:hypothetical protein